MSDCVNAAILDRLHGGELQPTEEDLVRSHLAVCEECRRKDSGLVDSRERLLRRLRSCHFDLGPDQDATVPATDGSWTSQVLELADYHILGPISGGSQGVIFEAIQRRTKRRVAIKMLVREAIAPAHARKRFLREIETIGSLDHPGIVTILHAGETPEGNLYYVMDYVEGRPFSDYVREKNLSPKQTVQLFTRLCDAISYAHERGIIHRDLKPANVLVTSTGEPRILDFGLAKPLGVLESSITHDGLLVGTVRYMSPEQARGDTRSIGPTADVYALGVMLYEALSGSSPYELGGELTEVLDRICKQPAATLQRSWIRGSSVLTSPTPRRTKAACPLDAELDNIVQMALAKEIDRRYADAGEFAEDLRCYLQNKPVRAVRPSLWYRTHKYIQRNRVPLAFCLALLIGLAYAAFSQVRTIRADHRARIEHARGLLVQAELESNRDPSMALRRCDEAIAIWPDFAEAKLKRAYMLLHLSKKDAALQAANEVIRSYPEYAAPAHLMLAEYYRLLDPGMAAKQKEMAISLKPGDKYYQALAMDADHTEQAIGLLSDVLEHDPLHADALFARAWRYGDLEDWDDMLADANELVHRWPTTPPYWNAKGYALARKGRLREALSAYDRCLELAPNVATLHITRAETRLAADKLADAQADCVRALHLDPKLAAAHVVLARVRVRQNMLDEAEQEAMTALRMAPHDSITKLPFVELAHAFFQSGSFDRALEAFNRAMADGRDDLSDHFYRAATYRLLGEYDCALGDYDSVLHDMPDDATTYVGRGLSYRMTGDVDSALADLSHGAELDLAWGAQCYLWIWELYALRDGPDSAEAAAALDLARTAADEPEEWLWIDACATGQVDEQARADIEDPVTLAQTEYYLGIAALARNDSDGAWQALQQCADFQDAEVPEVQLARFHVEVMHR